VEPRPRRRSPITTSLGQHPSPRRDVDQAGILRRVEHPAEGSGSEVSSRSGRVIMPGVDAPLGRAARRGSSCPRCRRAAGDQQRKCRSRPQGVASSAEGHPAGDRDLCTNFAELRAGREGPLAENRRMVVRHLPIGVAVAVDVAVAIAIGAGLWLCHSGHRPRPANLRERAETTTPITCKWQAAGSARRGRPPAPPRSSSKPPGGRRRTVP